MKVLLVHNFYQFWGGEDTYVTSLEKLLKKNGHTVILYSKDSKNIKSIWDKVKTGFGLFWNPQVTKELHEIIQKERPDVAHFNNIYPLIGATAYRVCKKHNIKIVQTIHNYRFMCPKGSLFRDGKICELCVNRHFFSPAIRFGCYHGSRFATIFYSLAFLMHRQIVTFSFIDTFIFPSQFAQTYYEKYFGILKSKQEYLPYFVDLKALKKKVKKKDWYLYVGRLSEEKGILQLLEVFKEVPKYTLKVIGGGPLEDKVNMYKKYKNIHILGYMDRKRIIPYYQAAKALIIPSLRPETGPINMIEAKIYNTDILTFNNINNVNRPNFKNDINKINLILKMNELNKFTNSKYGKNIDKYKPLYHLKQLLHIYSSQ